MAAQADFKYLETKILTASPEELTLIVFDVLIVSSTKALEKMKTMPGDIQGIHDDLRRAQRSLALLMGSLNFEIGGELATNLFRVYEFWHHELVLANMQKAPERVERLLPNFKEYRVTWAEAQKRRRVELAQGAAVSQGGFVAVG
ncbi:MAG: flagellar export chaperone FliS [Candidatus Velthaea sp.]